MQAATVNKIKGAPRFFFCVSVVVVILPVPATLSDGSFRRFADVTGGGIRSRPQNLQTFASLLMVSAQNWHFFESSVVATFETGMAGGGIGDVLLLSPDADHVGL